LLKLENQFGRENPQKEKRKMIKSDLNPSIRSWLCLKKKASIGALKYEINYIKVIIVKFVLKDGKVKSI